MKLVAGAVLVLFVCGAAHGQTSAQPLEFEVASIKLSPPRQPGTGQGTRGCTGGPGWKDPIRFVCSNASVSLLVIYAYDVKPYQIRPPVATDTVLFNVEAKVPPGATAEQLKTMLRNLLTARLKLAFHYEKSEEQGYALVVSKSGLKMKVSAADPPPAPEGAPPLPQVPVKDADGFLYIPPRNRMTPSQANGLTRWAGGNMRVEHIAGLLNSLTGRPIIDSTGLKGTYDFTLTFSTESLAAARGSAATSSPAADDSGIAAPDEGGLTVFAAVDRQLGLKLEPKKIPLDLFVIDRAEKTPVEN